FLLIDMKSPGITVKPIRTMDGYHHLNEVWMQDVRVPAENLIGTENGGWGIAKFLLKNERTAGSMVGNAAHALARLKQIPSADRPLLRQRIVDLDLRLLATETVAMAAVERMVSGNEDG